ncbi:hypothetical protein [Candidatus Rariloculus sp.]|uniref:hypothetical protein n=1 Tax=Candidatus Rariloculus sp. TaxID=3101265 RepID=UPI003D12AB0F
MQLDDPRLVRVKQVLIGSHDVVMFERHGCTRSLKQHVVVRREHIFPGQVQQLAMQRRWFVAQIRDGVPEQVVQRGTSERRLHLFGQLEEAQVPGFLVWGTPVQFPEKYVPKFLPAREGCGGRIHRLRISAETCSHHHGSVVRPQPIGDLVEVRLYFVRCVIRHVRSLSAEQSTTRPYSRRPAGICLQPSGVDSFGVKMFLNAG